MTTEQKIQAIKNAIEMAKNHQSKMDETAWNVPALSSLKIRHLMNNLGAISTNYLECGVHRGGLFCSTIRNNNLDTAFAIDSFASDAVTGEGIEDEFDKNSLNCIDGTETVMFTKVADTFTVMPSELPTIDLYLYDADHSYEAERKAVTHFLPAMSDVFILCKDDWQYGDVKRGTIDGIIDSGCDILFQEEFLNPEPYTEDMHLNDHFWRGFYLALLKKK